MELPAFITRDDDGLLHLTGHRIGIEHIVAFYNEGYSPEMLLGQFPTLSLALIHKAIAFYLEHQQELDAYVTQNETEVQRQREAASGGPGVVELRRRLDAMRQAEVR